jgi:hypothetical protein
MQSNQTKQIFLISLTLRHITKIHNSVSNSNYTSLPINYIFVRFIAAGITQVSSIQNILFFITVF